jgi:hypothetical protein
MRYIIIEVLLCLFAFTIIGLGILVGNIWQVIAGNFMLLFVVSLDIKKHKDKDKEKLP